MEYIFNKAITNTSDSLSYFSLMKWYLTTTEVRCASFPFLVFVDGALGHEPELLPR